MSKVRFVPSGGEKIKGQFKKTEVSALEVEFKDFLYLGIMSLTKSQFVLP